MRAKTKEERQEWAEWLMRQLGIVYSLPNAQLAECDEVLFQDMGCCGWHVGIYLAYGFLQKLGGELLPSAVRRRLGWGDEPRVFSAVWLDVFFDEYPVGRISSPISTPPHLGERSEDRPRWLLAAYQTWMLLVRSRQRWCDENRFKMSWTCCAWHSAQLLMQTHLKCEGQQLVDLSELPVEHDLLPDVFSNAWWAVFTKKYGLPEYRPY